jgi:hypothetical protein
LSGEFAMGLIEGALGAHGVSLEASDSWLA